MRRKKTDLVFTVGRQRCFLTVLAVAVVYLLLLTFEPPFFFPLAGAGAGGASLPRQLLLKTENGRLEKPRRLGSCRRRRPEPKAAAFRSSPG